MKRSRVLRCAVFVANLGLGIGVSPTYAAFHLWDINELYSNADGSVQFIELFTTSNSQQFLRNHTITARSADGSQTRTFTFPSNSGSPTRNRHLLIATAGFGDLPGGVTPDFILPAGFLFLPSGSVNFANADTVNYQDLPTDGVLSRTRGGVATNSPTNFAGQSGSIEPPPPPDPPMLLGSDMILSPLGENCGLTLFTFEATEPLTVVDANVTVLNTFAPSVTVEGLGGGSHKVTLSSPAPTGEWLRIDLDVVGNDTVLAAVLTLFVLHLPLDIDGNGEVTIRDATAFGEEFNGARRAELLDLNCDGAVDVRDATAFGNNWFGRPPATRPWQNAVAPEKPDAVLPIDVALLGNCGGGRPPSNAVSPGEDLHVVTLDDPEAICNDGSPGIFYIRAAADAANADRWVFSFQGGAGCFDYASCRQRWCGQHPIYTAAKMSSLFAPNPIRVAGIFNRERTSLADANLVFLYYCSSDSWAGQNSSAVLTFDEDPSLQYTLAFRGHSIVKAVMDRLLNHGPTTSDDGEETVPDLSQASEVLITGTSAGAVGARTNVDWMADQFDPAQTLVRAAFNAGMSPLATLIPDDAAPGEPTLIELLEADLQGRAELAGPTGYNSFVDESCATLMAGTDQEALCFNTNYITLNHMTTPFFLQNDLTDSVSFGNFQPLGVTRDAFGQGTHATLSLVPDIVTTAVEADAIDFTPGLFGPNCGRHVWLTNDGWYFDATIEDADGTPRSFDQALRAWLGGEDVILLDTHPSTFTVCGPDDPDIDP